MRPEGVEAFMFIQNQFTLFSVTLLMPLCGAWTGYASPLVLPQDTYGPHVMIEGDILIDVHSMDHAQANSKKIEKWEDGILPIQFDSSIAPDQRLIFLDACHAWSKVARVACIEGQYKNRTVKISAHSSMGCWALWGMGRHFLILRRQINLAPECWTQRTLTHEVGHAFGLIHEHQREDRDQYIKIITRNIKNKFLLNRRVNFEKQKRLDTQPYDFFSIMHYDRFAFSKNGGETLTPRPPYEAFSQFIGSSPLPSDGDAAKMQELYGAPASFTE